MRVFARRGGRQRAVFAAISAVGNSCSSRVRVLFSVAVLDIIDAHAHAFPDPIANHAIRSLCDQGLWLEMRNHHDGTVGGLLASMDSAGIRRAVLCSVATKPTQVEKITDWSVAVASERIIPFASIHPAYEQPEREIERVVGLGLRGLKFHPQYMNCAVDDPRAVRIARAAAKAGLAFVIHAGYHPAYPKLDEASPLRVRRLHDAVPDLRLLACHMGGLDDWQSVNDYIIGSDMYVETSFALAMFPPDVLAAMLARHDPRRLLFGTDTPWQNQTQELERFRGLPLTPEALELALSTNALRFIGEAAASVPSRA